jgi:glutamate---cysteine ligase / carboxylate-amine ligase
MPLTEPSLTLGIEEEYLLVDPQTRDLAASPPKEFMVRCKDRLGDRVTHELLQAQVEVGTDVCRTAAEARADLAHLRGTVAEIAREHGMALIAASTHPFASWRDQRRVEHERYALLAYDMQTLAERLVICGMHVHAGIEDDNLRIDLMNQATYFLPHLLVLSTSSPFWQGRDTGLKAYRPTIFGDLPRSGLPEYFDDHDEWRRLLVVLAETGLCDDPTKIWWDLRPSVKHPTLEMRVCDVCTRLEDAITVAAVYQALLAMLYRLRTCNQTWRKYRHVLIDENKWRAQRWGTGGKLCDFGRRELVPYPDLLEEIIALTREEALRLGCSAEIEHARDIVARGTSADRQLSIYREARLQGADEREALNAVVDWLIAETVVGVATGPAEPAATAPDPAPAAHAAHRGGATAP